MLLELSLVLPAVKKTISLVLISVIAELTGLSLMEYIRSGSYTLKSFAVSALNLDLTWQEMRSFAVMEIFFCLFSICTGFLLCRFIAGRNVTIRLMSLILLLAAVILNAGLFVLAGAFKDDTDENISIVSAAESRRVIINEEPKIRDTVTIAYNGKLPCDLLGLYLSDDKEEPFKLPLSGHRLKMGERMDVYPEEGGYFSVTDKSELYLTDRDKGIICEYENKKRSLPKRPVLSAASGFYDEPFYLELKGEGGDKIYYSIDGSDPLSGGMEYTSPIYVYDRSAEEAPFHGERRTVYDWYAYSDADIPTYVVDRCFTVNAVAVDKDGRASGMSIGNYFIDKGPYDGLVLSLVADKEDLFGEYGINVTGKEYDKWVAEGMKTEAPTANFDKSGREWEIPAYISCFKDGKLISEQEAGLRIQGGESRAYQYKRYSIYSREEYSGSDYFDVSFFEEDDIPVHSVALRPALADAVFPALTRHRDVIGTRHIPVKLFLNGEYWRETYLCEKYSAKFFMKHFGIPKDSLIALKNGELDIGEPGDEEAFKEIYDYIESHDMADDASYYGLDEIMDIQNYIEYSCINLYAANLDYDEVKNTYIWKTKDYYGSGYSDGRWRWAIYDIDALDWEDPELWELDDKAKINTFKAKPPYLELSFDERPIFKALAKNRIFLGKFEETFADMINTDFSPENAGEALGRLGGDITAYDSFFIKRPDYMLQYLEEEIKEISGGESQ